MAHPASQEGESGETPRSSGHVAHPGHSGRRHRHGDRGPENGDDPPPYPHPPAEHTIQQLSDRSRSAGQGRNDEGGRHGSQAVHEVEKGRQPLRLRRPPESRTAGAHTAQEKAKVSAKKSAKGCLRVIEPEPARVREPALIAPEAERRRRTPPPLVGLPVSWRW